MKSLSEQNRIKRGLQHASELHDQHLCYLLSQGFNLSDGQEYEALIDHPEFRCGHCGRQANRDESLCVPAQL